MHTFLEICAVRMQWKKWRGKREKKRVEISKSGKIKHCHRVLSLSPRLVSAPHHGSGFLLPSLVMHWVHKLKDVRGTKLECGA